MYVPDIAVKAQLCYSLFNIYRLRMHVYIFEHIHGCIRIRVILVTVNI